MNRGRNHLAPRNAGLQALNTANADAQLDDLLRQYFRLALPPSSATTTQRRLKRPRLAADTVESTTLLATATPEAALKRIKTFLKASTDDKHIQRVLNAVTHQLRRAKRQPKLLPLAVQLTTELFARSAAFRTLIATQAAAFFMKLLEAAGEDDVATRRHRLSVPAQKAKHSPAVTMVLAMVETWREDFGARYPTIVAGHAWLVEMGYEFPRVRETSEQAVREKTERVRHQISVRQLQVQKMELEMATSVPEMETTIVEMDSIFEILVPTLEAFELEEKAAEGEENKEQDHTRGRVRETHKEEDDDDDVEWEEAGVAGKSASAQMDGGYQSSAGQEGGEGDGEDDIEWEDVETDDNNTGFSQDDEERVEHDDDAYEQDDGADEMDINDIVQAYGLGSSTYQLTISIPTTLCEQSAENEVLFQSLADGVLQIRKRFLPLVSDWLQIADGDAVALEQPRDVALVRRLHVLRSRLESATLKWEDLVKENERKQFARIHPRVVTLPLAAFDGSVSHSNCKTNGPPRARRTRQKLL